MRLSLQKLFVICSLFAILTFGTIAQVKKINEFSIGPKQSAWAYNDIYGRFHNDVVTTTPEGDIFVFSSRESGTWELTRVRNWMTATPEIKHLPLSGYFSIKERNDLDDIPMHLYTLPDSQFIICVASAEWMKREHGRAVGEARNKLIVTVIDKESMMVHTNKTIPDDTSPDFQSIELSNTDELIYSKSHWSAFSNSLGSHNRHEKYTLLSMPELVETDSCDVEWKPTQPGAGDDPFPLMDESCTRLLHGRTFREMMTAKSDKRIDGYKCKDKNREYCPQPEIFTSDGKIGLGFLTSGHDSLLGSWVEDSATAVLFSCETKSEIAAYDIKHDNLDVQLATAKGKDYLIGYKKRSVFVIYEIEVH